MYWLDESNPERILSVDARYLKALRAWVEDLDKIEPGDSFVYDAKGRSKQSTTKRTKKRS